MCYWEVICDHHRCSHQFSLSEKEYDSVIQSNMAFLKSTVINELHVTEHILFSDFLRVCLIWELVERISAKY